jgi:hypothetical protein
VICLAAGLMVKPHDVGLVWLYFMLAGRSYRCCLCRHRSAGNSLGHARGASLVF